MQIYAATNGYLDRITVDKVERFLSELIDYGARQRARAAQEDRRRRLERGDPQPSRGRRSQFAEDFGYDLDEEGHAARRRGAGGVTAARMATSQRDVRNRISAVKNIQKITRAMEMVAAARLRRAEQRIEALRPYADAIRRMTRQAAKAAGDVPRLPILPSMQHVARSGCCSSPAIAASRVPSTPTSSAPGSPPAASTMPQGRRVRLLRLRPPAGVVAHLPGVRAGAELHRLHRPSRLRRRAPDRRTADGGLHRRRGRPGRDLLQRLHLADLAGRAARDAAAAAAGDRARRTSAAEEPAPPRADSNGRCVEYEPDPEEMLRRLVPDYVEISIYRALLESTASEHGARMTAMRNASDNAGELIED